MARQLISFVLPVYNEEAVLPLLVHRMKELVAELDQALDADAEIIFVDDGSSDLTGVFISGLARADALFRYVALSRNFGQQAAMTAGMEAARGDAVILMDADLQDPPYVAKELIKKWREGFEIVYARRARRDGETMLKKVTSSLFYTTISKLASIDIPRDTGDFRLIDRAALDAFLAMPEQNRFVRGMFAWVGFRQTAVLYHREARAAGKTRYNYRKLSALAASALVSFSDAPLRVALWVGAAVSLMAMAYGVYVIGLGLFWRGNMVEGWASTMVVISFLSGVNLLMTGVVGVYVGRIYAEAKKRPLFIVARKVGFDRDRAEAPVEAPVPLRSVS